MNGMLANLLVSRDGLIAFVLIILFGSNAVLTVMKKYVDKLVAANPSNAAEGKLDLVLAKVLSWSAKVLEFISANSTALPPQSKAIVDSENQKS